MNRPWLARVAMFGLQSLVSWLSYSYVVRDGPAVRVRAVLQQVTCVLQSSGPDSSVGPSGPEAIPPITFQRGIVTAVLGAARLLLHEFPDEPAVVTVRALFGDVTIRTPDEHRPWNVRLDPRVVAGRVRDDRPEPEASDDPTVQLVVNGFVVFGRVRLVSQPEDDG